MLSTSATGFRETPLSALGKFNPLLDAILRLGDLAVLVTSGMIAFALRFGSLELGTDYVHVLSRGVLFAVIVLNGSSLYPRWRGRTMGAEFVKLVRDNGKTAVRGVESSLTAILGRMAMDLRREVTWDEMMKS